MTRFRGSRERWKSDDKSGELIAADVVQQTLRAKVKYASHYHSTVVARAPREYNESSDFEVRR